MKKFLCAILTLILLAGTLTGCSPNKINDLAGTWETEIGIPSSLSDQLNAELDGLFSLEDLRFTMRITFNEDGTYQVTLDRASVEAAFDSLLEDLEADLISGLESAIGLDISIEELLEMTGRDLDSLMDEALAMIDMDSLIDKVVDGTTFSGNYQLQEGKLFLSAGVEYQPDPGSYVTYSVSGNTLTLSDPGIENSSFAGLYPLVFQKVS